jgi:DNA topoisomerase IA
VAVKLIVEKENEIKNFKPQSKWEIKAKIIKENSEEYLKKE